MPQNHSAKKNEDWSQIADAYGFRNWKTIYNHESNKKLRERDDPYILHEGDKVFIPDKQPKEHQCDTNRRHTFRLPTPTRIFSLILQDDDQIPYEDTKYEIWIGGKKHVGPNEDPAKVKRTNKHGLICEELPVVEKIELRVWFDRESENDPGAYEADEIEPWHLDSVDTVEGVQHRLENLGYSCGEDTHGELGPDTKEALKVFQEDYGLSPTGKIDKETEDALLKLHD